MTGRGRPVRLPPHPGGLRIGLYGGSFDPPHAGHRHVALAALRRLRLDRLWWIVGPGNPLKDRGRLPDAAARVAASRRVAAHPRIVVTDFEAALGFRYTIATIRHAVSRGPGARFVYVMGADSFATLHRWRDWRRIGRLVPIAVVDRPGWGLKALRSPAARAFAAGRATPSAFWESADLPRWTFLAEPRTALSSTALRALSPSVRSPEVETGGPAALSYAIDAGDTASTEFRALNPLSVREADAPPSATPTDVSGPPPQPAEDVLGVAMACLDDMKADEVVSIDLVGRTSLADTMVIASGRSARHVGSIAERVVTGLKEAGHGRVRVEGFPACDWVLIDAGDVIVHVFRPEVRGFYNLEKMWGVDRPGESPAPSPADMPAA